MSLTLYAPESYLNASPEIRAIVTNGCGPGGWKIDLVPDTIWGLNIADCCDIHDWMYQEGETEEERTIADRVLLNNLLRKVNAKTRFGPLRWLRRRRALNYYYAVRAFGGPAFWGGKNKEAEEFDPQLLPQLAMGGAARKNGIW